MGTAILETPIQAEELLAEICAELNADKAMLRAYQCSADETAADVMVSTNDDLPRLLPNPNGY